MHTFKYVHTQIYKCIRIYKYIYSSVYMYTYIYILCCSFVSSSSFSIFFSIFTCRLPLRHHPPHPSSAQPLQQVLPRVSYLCVCVCVYVCLCVWVWVWVCLCVSICMYVFGVCLIHQSWVISHTCECTSPHTQNESTHSFSIRVMYEYGHTFSI